MPAHLIAKEGPLAGLVLDFDHGDDWIIGRDPDVADLVVEDSTVSRKHARITKTPQGFFFQNLSQTNPASVNGEPRKERVLLQEGDRVQIGHHTFVFSGQDASTEESPPHKKSKAPKTSSGYDDIFGELEEPPPPSKEEDTFHTDPIATPPLGEPIQEREETAYDTIFEDIEEPGEIPFHLMPPTTLLLKVISGPNAGAEIGIEKNKSYVIGKDSGVCDVVFQDLSVSRNHARLSVDEEGHMTLEDLGSKNGTSVNGTLITEKTVLQPQDMVALGTTVFLVIDREAPQETIYSSLVPSYEPPKEAESVEAEQEAPSAEQAPWKETPIPSKHLIAAGSFLAIFLIIFLSFFSLFKAQKLEVVHKEPGQHIKEALSKFDDVQFSYNPGSGKLFLTGHVVTSVDYQELMYRIDQLPGIESVDNTVVIDELVWKMTNNILSDMPNFRAVSLHSPTAGTFVVSGYVTTAADAAALNEYLTSNFPYLDRLKNNVAIEEVLNVEIQNVLRAQGLGAVTFQLVGGELILSGGYAKKMKHKYDEALKKLNALKGIARVRDLTTATEADSTGIDITQNYRVSGSARSDGHGYSVVLNGKIYTVGDTVDGMAIESIGEKTIFLEKDGLNYRIDYR